MKVIDRISGPHAAPMSMGEVELERVDHYGVLVRTAKAREVRIPFLALHEDSAIWGIRECDITGKTVQRQQVGERGRLILRRWYVEKMGWLSVAKAVG